MKSHWRFLVIVVMLTGIGVLLQARNGQERIPARPTLASFPHELNGWVSRDIPIDQQTRDILGAGDFLLRAYVDTNTRKSVDLFVAYFPSQRAGDTIHSPKNCLPGSGWFPIQADRITLELPGHRPFPANRYLIAKGQDRQLVLYWYWAHNRGVASEYAAKLYLVTDSIRLHRSDGSLFRITTSLAPNQDVMSAQQVLVDFAANIAPLIDTYVPR